MPRKCYCFIHSTFVYIYPHIYIFASYSFLYLKPSTYDHLSSFLTAFKTISFSWCFFSCFTKALGMCFCLFNLPGTVGLPGLECQCFSNRLGQSQLLFLQILLLSNFLYHLLHPPWHLNFKKYFVWL